MGVVPSLDVMSWNWSLTASCGTTFSRRDNIRYRWLQSSLMPSMISVCLDNRFPCSPCIPGGRFRSLEKSTQGGPDVIRIIRSSVPWAACLMSSLSWGLVRRETSPCCMDWKWCCKSAWHCGFVSQLRVKTMLAPKYCRATDAAPIPSKKLRWSMGRWQMCFLSSCWMRGISGGGVAAVPTPSCPYCHWCLDFPFLPPLPFGFWWSCALGGGVHCGLDGWACWCHWTGGGGGFQCVCSCHCCTCCVCGLFGIGWYWYGGGLWYGWFW